MGRQRNQYYIGRQAHLVYYQWRGGYYVRTKSTLSGKRFWKDPAFAASRKRAVEFGDAAKLAAEVYALLPQEGKKRCVIGRLTGWAHKGLMAGKSRDAVTMELLAACGLSAPADRSSAAYMLYNGRSSQQEFGSLRDPLLNKASLTAHGLKGDLAVVVSAREGPI